MNFTQNWITIKKLKITFSVYCNKSRYSHTMRFSGSGENWCVLTGRYSLCHTMRFCSCQKSFLQHFRHFRTFIGILRIIRSIANITLVLYLRQWHSAYVIFIFLKLKKILQESFLLAFPVQIFTTFYNHQLNNYLFSIIIFTGSKFWKIYAKSHKSYSYISIKNI